LSTDPTRRGRSQRSSKKRRATQAGAARRSNGRVRGGSATPPSGGIPGVWLALGAVVVFVIGVLLASGTIGGPGGGAGRGGAGASGTATSPAGTPVARGTNCATSQPPPAPAGETRVVTVQTAKGSFVITLNADLSPIAVGNFAALAACGYYDGIGFHRVATLGDGTPFVIQGGDPTGSGTDGPG